MLNIVSEEQCQVLTTHVTHKADHWNITIRRHRAVPYAIERVPFSPKPPKIRVDALDGQPSPLLHDH